MAQINPDFIEPTENGILTPGQFVQWVKQRNPEGNKEFIAEPVTVVNTQGDEVSWLPGHWIIIDRFQSGQVMYRQK